MPYPKYLQSSVDANSLSLTLKGLVPLIISVAIFFNLDVAEMDLTGVIDAIVVIVVSTSTIVSAIATLIGLVRKIINI